MLRFSFASYCQMFFQLEVKKYIQGNPDEKILSDGIVFAIVFFELVFTIIFHLKNKLADSVYLSMISSK